MQPNRKSQRKQDYDYSQPGYYSVTNHLHGIIIIRAVGTAPRGRPNPAIKQCPAIENGQAQGPVPTGLLSLSDVIEQFKSLIT